MVNEMHLYNFSLALSWHPKALNNNLSFTRSHTDWNEKAIHREVTFNDCFYMTLKKIEIVAIVQQIGEHCACKHPRFDFYKADRNMRSLIDQCQNWSFFKFLLHVNSLVRLWLDKACLHVPHRSRYTVPREQKQWSTSSLFITEVTIVNFSYWHSASQWH